MGSKFIEKHKRKSVLAALLFLFHGRVKYVAVMLILVLMSLPFVISGEVLGRILEFSPLATMLRSVGLGSVVSTISPGHSEDLFKAALDRAVQESENNSFWNKFLKSINATMPPAGSASSMTMLRGGGDIFGLPRIKDAKGAGAKRGPGQVKGAVNDEERQRGETGDAVDLESLLAGMAGRGGGAGNGGGLYGDLMGQNLAGRFSGGGASAGNAPYLNRAMFGGGNSPSGGGNSVSGKSAGMYNNVMGVAGSKVPVPGAPQKVNTKKMGKVSGFTWKNVGYKTKSNAMNAKIGDKKPMFQLAETFSMTASASKSQNTAYEAQAAYTGATYDGNDVNLDIMQTDAAAPVLPDNAYAGDVMGNAEQLQQVAKDCSDSQGTNGAKMSEDAAQIEHNSNNMGSAPQCYNHGAVAAWNAKVAEQKALCQDFNVNNTILSGKCQTDTHLMDCAIYSNYTTNGGMLIRTCPRPSRWLRWVIMFALLIIMIIAAIFQVWFVVALAFAAMLATYALVGNSAPPADSAYVKGADMTEQEEKGGFDRN
ncbi:MAG TPA: hypothetical protein DCS63_09190 [Elusimicrobia bacterium]|nr:hypothetical protein [Elusimicrobiota bacterium]